MGCMEGRQSAAETTCGHVTLVFVDIDGVLNIGISDPGHGGALSCNTDNISRANKISEETLMKSTSWQRLAAVTRRHAGEGNSTYGDLCKGSAHLADIFVERLAVLVAAAERQGRVICVLSSTWRIKNLKGVRELEEGVSNHMGKPFTFDAKTDAKESGNPSGRLENIGNFLTQWLKTSAGTFESVRALVLEDFHISPLNGWSCHGMSMNSVQDVEAYLYKCLPPLMNVAVRFVHTFDQWTTARGMGIQVGCGLTSKHFDRAMDFLKPIEAVRMFFAAILQRRISNTLDRQKKASDSDEAGSPAPEDTDTAEGTDFDDYSCSDDGVPFERGVSSGPECPSSA